MGIECKVFNSSFKGTIRSYTYMYIIYVYDPARLNQLVNFKPSHVSSLGFFLLLVAD